MYHDVSLKLIHGFADSGLPEYCTIFHLPHPFVRMSQASHHTFSPVSDDLDLTNYSRRSKFPNTSFSSVEILKLKFGLYFDADVWLRFWFWLRFWVQYCVDSTLIDYSHLDYIHLDCRRFDCNDFWTVIFLDLKLPHLDCNFLDWLDIWTIAV